MAELAGRGERVDVPAFAVAADFHAVVVGVGGPPHPGGGVLVAGVQPAAAAEGEEAARPAVFVLEEGQARRIEVTLGAESDAERLVTAGLRGGETVIANPPAGLRDGANVVAKKASGAK